MQLATLTVLLFFALLVLALLALLIFWKTDKVFIPKIMLGVISFFESPLKVILKLFRINSRKVDYAIISIANNLYRPAYARVPYKDRAIFIPQCLRSPKCPAKLSPQGIQCINCGRCGLGELKKYSEGLGCKFFIVPGSTFIRRLIKKHKPKAILGVGCTMELTQGAKMVYSIDMPGQGILLRRDGCVDTRVDISRLMDIIALSEKDTTVGKSLKNIISDLKDNIQNMWKDEECPRD